jgi:steroid delta-isomerase-like uncharacterized protein
MSAEDNKAVVRNYFAALDEQRLEVAADMLALEYRLHLDGNPEMSREAALGLLGAFLTALPDIRHEIKDQLAEGDRVATRIVVTGTHQAELMGIPATGKTIVISSTNIHRIDHGKIVEQWANSDALGMLQQLGAIPAPGQPGE